MYYVYINKYYIYNILSYTIMFVLIPIPIPQDHSDRKLPAAAPWEFSSLRTPGSKWRAFIGPTWANHKKHGGNMFKQRTKLGFNGILMEH